MLFRSEATTPLTVKGTQDAIEVADKLKDKGITQIIATDTERTRSTADIVRSQLGLEDVFFQSQEEYNKKQKDEYNIEPYNLFTLANLLLFIIIYFLMLKKPDSPQRLLIASLQFRS